MATALEVVRDESPKLLAAVKFITDKVEKNPELIEQAKIVTEATQRIANVLTSGNADTPASPRGDSLAGRLKEKAATLIRHRRDALEKGDGVTAMKDLEIAEDAASDIRKLMVEIEAEAANPGSSTPAPPPAPVAETKPEPAVNLAPPPSLPTAAPPKESNPTSSVTLSSPDRPRTTTSGSSSPASVSTSTVPAWQQKLLSKKGKLDENLTPAKKSSGSAASEAPAKWAAPKEKETPKTTATNPSENITLTIHAAVAKKEDSASPPPSAGSPPPPPAPAPAPAPPPPVAVEEVTLTLTPPPKAEEKKAEKPPEEKKVEEKKVEEKKVEKKVEEKKETPKKETSSASSSSGGSSSRKSGHSKGSSSSASSTPKDEKPAETKYASAKPTSVAKVSDSGSSLSPSLEKKVGRMSAVKTLSVEVAATSAAIEKCRDAQHNSTTRYIILKLEKEQLDLVSSGDKTGTPASDFANLKTLVNEKDPSYIFYRYKDDGPAPWALISWLPESTPVKVRMVYATSVASTTVLVGAENVSKQVAFNTLKQFVWDDFHVEEIKLKNREDFLAPENDAALPFSDRELAQRQVEREERQARVELGTKAKEASGFHQVAFPLAAEAEQAVKEMLTGAHSWVQLSLDSAFKTIELRDKKSPTSVAELGDLLHKTEPQFYLYLFKDQIPVLIYCCPEKGPTIKNKMVYSTCKSTLADTILSCGFSDIKKLDIREPSDLTEAELNDAYAAKAGFKPTEGPADTSVVLAGPKSSPGAGRYGGMGGIGGLGAVIAGKANLKKGNQ